MSNLIPTPIVDKNGKLTTVHKKTQVTVSHKALPSVALPKPNNLANVAAHRIAQEWADSQSMGAMSAIIYETAFEFAFKDALAGLKNCSPETLQRITGPGMTGDHRLTLVNGLGDGWSEETINDFMHAASVMNDTGMYYKEMKDYLISFEYYSELEPTKGGHYPEERAHQITAITKVLRHMHTNPHNISDIEMWHEFYNDGEWEEVPYIKDDKLRALILTSAHDRDAIVDIITERSIFDADQIIEMLSANDTSALRAGNL
jgi:hypothetical protein